MKNKHLLGVGVLLGVVGLLGACSEEQTKGDVSQLSGQVVGDGSSTVAPIMEAIVEQYSVEEPDVRVSVGVSGTGGGFEKFINDETDFSNASREIKDEEHTALKKANIDFTEFELAYDGISVVIHPENSWAQQLTVEQLAAIWVENGQTKKWSDIDPSWPDEDIVFYSPGVDSGTYDYFDEVILDGEDLVANATLSEDDNVLVQGVASDLYAIGYFGFSYYVENTDKVTAVSIDGVAPSSETIKSGEYSPLSRPLYVYVKNEAVATNDAVFNFIQYTFTHAAEMAQLTGYVALPKETYEENVTELQSLK